MNIPALVIAGGKARRMKGADKPFCLLGGDPLIAHVMRRLKLQTSPIVICANGDPKRFALWESPVVADSIGQDYGPLAGVLAGMEWVASHLSDVEFVLTVPVDTPFLPMDLLQCLVKGQKETGAEVVMASGNGHVHFLTALWPLSIASELRRLLVERKTYQVKEFVRNYRRATIDFSGGILDPFMNINSEGDLAQAEGLL